jgi:hypothetical protein
VAVYLPEATREQVGTFPETHYGVQTVRVTLADGRVFRGVQVAWGREVVRVDGYPEIPFSEEQVVVVEDDSKPA